MRERYKQIVECSQAFVGKFKPTLVFKNESLRAQGRFGRIYIDGRCFSTAEMINKAFVFASQNGFVRQNFIGYADRLVKQIRSDSPVKVKTNL